MLREAFKNDEKEFGDKAALYPRQFRPEGYVRPQQPSKPKIENGHGLADLLKTDADRALPMTSAGAAFAAYNAVKRQSIAGDACRRPTASPADFLAHWKGFAAAKSADTNPIRRRIEGVMKNINLEGFRRASRATTWRLKAFWLTLMAFFACITIYEGVKCVQAYYQSPVTTTYTLLTPDAMDFPQVYLCYGSSLNRSYITMHKDQMAIATVYRSRSAVTKGGNNRRKRDIGRSFSSDNSDVGALTDDEISRILMRSMDQHVLDSEVVNHHESEKWWQNGALSQDLEDTANDDDLFQEDEFIPDDESQAPELERGKREARNSSFNATQAAEAQAKAAQAAQAKRIEAMMNAPNISEVVYQYIRDAAYRIQQTFVECEFQSHKRETLDCEKLMVPIMDANYGMCFLVDLPDDMKQMKAGHGLRLLINSHVHLYPRTNEGAPKYAGVLVSINKQYDPFNWLKSLAAPGHVTKVDLDASYVELLDLRSGPLIQPCVDDEVGSQMLRIFKSNYSRTICQMDCLYQAHRNACQCILPVDKSQVKEEILNDTSFCGPKQFKGCLASSAEATDRAVNACRDHCHTPCKSYRYEMRSSSAKLYGPAFAHVGVPTNELIELRVAYSRKEIVQLIQKPSASIADLVSNIGGHVNLWLGASMITLLQLTLMIVGFAGYRLYIKINNWIKYHHRK